MNDDQFRQCLSGIREEIEVRIVELSIDHPVLGCSDRRVGPARALSVVPRALMFVGSLRVPEVAGSTLATR
jgi:hypothetical protein